MSGVPVATRYTYEFVVRSLPPGARELLEIGCGAGELAALLQKDGFGVVAIDSDEGCVSAATAREVDARAATWPARLDQRFDAVLFTRSLHHIHELDEAVAAAVQALRPGGRVIVEDFRAEGGSARGAAWFTSLVKLLHAADAFESGFNLDEALAKTETIDHEHSLHSSTAIAGALATFGSVEAEESAYYFRYLEADLRSPRAAELLLEHELALVAACSIDALGRRFLLSP